MNGERCNGFEEDENRLAVILKDDVDGFLASAAESDFIFDASNRLNPMTRRRFEVFFQQGGTLQTRVAARRHMLTVVLLAMAVTGVVFLFFLRFHSSSSHHLGNQNTEVAYEKNEPVNCDSETEPIVLHFSPGKIYGRGIEALDAFSKKYWTDEVDVILDATNLLTSWGETEGFASFLQTPNRHEGDDSVLEDGDNLFLPETLSPQEIVLATLSVSALVFTIEKFYNDAELGRRTEL